MASSKIGVYVCARHFTPIFMSICQNSIEDIYKSYMGSCFFNPPFYMQDYYHGFLIAFLHEKRVLSECVHAYVRKAL